MEGEIVQSQPRSKSVKIAIVTIAWGLLTGILAISIFLASLTNDAVILPLAIAIAASGSIVAIWHTYRRQIKRISELKHNVQILNKRIMVLEAMFANNNLNDFNVRENFKRIESSVVEEFKPGKRF
jgi:membrane protein implicated in regulation of membrane protease activity